jgi:hypothetical protein
LEIQVVQKGEVRDQPRADRGGQHFHGIVWLAGGKIDHGEDTTVDAHVFLRSGFRGKLADAEVNPRTPPIARHGIGGTGHDGEG